MMIGTEVAYNLMNDILRPNAALEPVVERPVHLGGRAGPLSTFATHTLILILYLVKKQQAGRLLLFVFVPADFQIRQSYIYSFSAD